MIKRSHPSAFSYGDITAKLVAEGLYGYDEVLKYMTVTCMYCGAEVGVLCEGECGDARIHASRRALFHEGPPK